jgi:hypothetical protein
MIIKISIFITIHNHLSFSSKIIIKLLKLNSVLSNFLKKIVILNIVFKHKSTNNVEDKLN